MSDIENLKDKLHTAVAFSPAPDNMAPRVAEKLKKKKRSQPPLTSEPERPTRARQLHADDAEESGLAEHPPTSDGSQKGRPQQARAPPAEYPPSDDLLWGGQAVADFLGISLDRLYYLIRIKRLPIAKLGRKTIVASKKKLQRALADTLAA